MYETGYGVPVDLKKAVSCYNKCNEIAEALNNLGCMYEEGLGVEPDLPKAVELFKRASRRGRGYAPALENLRRLGKDEGQPSRGNDDDPFGT